MKHFLDLSIRIGAPSDAAAHRYPVFVEGPGGSVETSVAFPSGTPEFGALVERLGRLEADGESIERLGQLIFLTLFGGQARDVLLRSQAMLERDQGLRLRLAFDPALTELAVVPWEFIYDPEQGPLVLLDAPLVRHIPQSSPIPELAVSAKLRILLSGASTPPNPPIDRELAAVRRALETLGDRVTLVVEPHLTVAALADRLREGVDIWHFVGHGRFRQADGQGMLLLEDEHGDSDTLTSRELGVHLFRSGVRLVVLNACDSARLTVYPFRALAPALVRAQVPAVIAQQFSVSTDASRSFAERFYRALADGLPLEGCLTEGRRAVMDLSGLDSADWGIPVLYTRTHDGELIAPAAPAAPPAPPIAAAPPAAAGSAPMAPPAPPISGERRLDMAAPSAAPRSRAFDVIAQVRFAGAPLLGKAEWPTKRVPEAVEQSAETIDLTFPVDPATGVVGPGELLLRVIAPECDVQGASEYKIDVPPDRFSRRVGFLLVPKHVGSCRVGVEAYRADGTFLGASAVEVLVEDDSGVIAGSVKTDTARAVASMPFAAAAAVISPAIPTERQNAPTEPEVVRPPRRLPGWLAPLGGLAVTVALVAAVLIGGRFGNIGGTQGPAFSGALTSISSDVNAPCSPQAESGLVVRVRDAAGAPVAGATITVLAANGRSVMGETNKRGDLFVTGLACASYTVTLTGVPSAASPMVPQTAPVVVNGLKGNRAGVAEVMFMGTNQ